MATCYGYRFSAKNSDGTPVRFGLVYSYEAGGTSTAKVTYKDRDLTIPNTNPVELDAAGQADIHLDGATSLVVKTAAEVTVDSNTSVGGEDNTPGTTTVGSLVLTGDAIVHADLTVTGDADLNGAFSAGGRIAVTGNVVFDGSPFISLWYVTCSSTVAVGASIFVYDYIKFYPRSATGVPNNSIFMDESDNIIKLRDNAGDLKLLYA